MPLYNVKGFANYSEYKELYLKMYDAAHKALLLHKLADFTLTEVMNECLDKYLEMDKKEVKEIEEQLKKNNRE